jgi:hypothetical protein
VDGKRRVELIEIVDAIQDGRVRITDHAYEEANADQLKGLLFSSAWRSDRRVSG